MAFVCPPLDDEQCEKSFRWLLNRINKADRGQWVINWGKIPVGLIHARCDAARNAVEVGVLISPLHQSKGLAMQAHQMLFEKLKKLNWPQHYLAFCHQDNHKAHGLYVSLGFERSGQKIKGKTEKSIVWEKK